MVIVEAKAAARFPTLSAGVRRSSVRESSPPGPQKPRLLDRVRQALRALMCCRLRVQDIDFATNQIVVRGGKGDKDRVTMLPGIAKAELARHLDIARAQHQRA